MTTLVVFCHPVPDSFGAHLKDRIASAVPGRVEVVDLYDGRELPIGFDETHATALAGASTLVLVYPTWWSSLPAPLMRWIEVTLEADLLVDVQTLVAVTTHGSSRLVDLVTGGIGRRILTRGVRRHLSDGARVTFVALYSMDRIDDERRRRFVERATVRVTEAVRSAG